MKLDLLRAGLQQLVDSDDERSKEALEAIAEIEKTQQLVADSMDGDAYDGECFVLYASDAVGLMIEATYDIYGRLFVSTGRTRRGVTFARYARAVASEVTECLPRSMLVAGYDVIADLYESVECSTGHNADGTYKR